MLRINKDVEYALISLIEVGRSSEVVSARELASRFDIPYGLLCKILYRLAHAGIVASVQGPKGGYRLAKPLAALTVGNVTEAIHGPAKVAACLDEAGDCTQLENCNIRGIMRQVQSKWDLFINSMTLAEFASMDEEVGAQEPR